MNSELKSKLEKLALQKSKPFCYSCYQSCPTGVCPSCHSDDLMRLTANGCEYGLGWVIEEIIYENLTPVDLETAFEDFISECYPSQNIGFLQNIDTAWAMKNLDPVAWDMAKSEYIDSEESEEIIFSIDNGSNYYLTSDLESFLDESDL